LSFSYEFHYLLITGSAWYQVGEKEEIIEPRISYETGASRLVIMRARCYGPAFLARGRRNATITFFKEAPNG